MIPGVEADFFGHIGRKYSLPSTDGDRIGYVMVVGAELNAAWATLEKCKKIIQVKYLYENH